jgi:hypothetical protein
MGTNGYTRFFSVNEDLGQGWSVLGTEDEGLGGSQAFAWAGAKKGMRSLG